MTIRCIKVAIHAVLDERSVRYHAYRGGDHCGGNKEVQRCEGEKVADAPLALVGLVNNNLHVCTISVWRLMGVDGAVVRSDCGSRFLCHVTATTSVDEQSFHTAAILATGIGERWTDCTCAFLRQPTWATKVSPLVSCTVLYCTDCGSGHNKQKQVCGVWYTVAGTSPLAYLSILYSI